MSAHILILPSWYPDTPDDLFGCFFREQAIAVAERGVRVGVVYPSLRSLHQWRSIFSGKYGLQVENDECVLTYRVHGIALFPLMKQLSRWHWVSMGMRLFNQYVQKHGIPDLIHVHSMLNAGALALEIQRQHRVPYVVTEHSTTFARGVLSAKDISTAQKIALCSKRRFAVSLPFCELLENQLGNDVGAWEPMPNIVQHSFLEKKIGDSYLDKNGVRFLAIAMLTEKKAIDNLIQAFAQSFAGKDGYFLDIGGDGVERPRLEKMVQNLNIQKQVRFLGLLSRAQVIEVMTTADVFVLPSRYETFGVVVIEALALGKPVIATRCGGPEFIVKQGDGLLIPTNDVNALSKAMGELSMNLDKYDPLEIRERCRHRYSEDAVTSRLLSVYREIMETL